MDDLTYRVLTACRGELIGLYPGLGEAFGWLDAVVWLLERKAELGLFRDRDFSL